MDKPYLILRISHTVESSQKLYAECYTFAALKRLLDNPQEKFYVTCYIGGIDIMLGGYPAKYEECVKHFLKYSGIEKE